MNLSSAFRVASVAASLLAAASVAACGSGEEKTTFIIVGTPPGAAASATSGGPSADTGAFTLTGSSTASGSTGACHASVTSTMGIAEVDVTCNSSGDAATMVELHVGITTTNPLPTGTFDDLATLVLDPAGDVTFTFHGADSGLVGDSQPAALRSLSLTLTAYDPSDDTSADVGLGRRVFGSVHAVSAARTSGALSTFDATF